MKQTDPQFKVRIPPSLKTEVEESARRNNRSITAEIVTRLSMEPSNRATEPEGGHPKVALPQEGAGSDDDRYTRITLRIPKVLHARLQEEADLTSKSMNAEIVARVESSFVGKASLTVAAGSFSGQVRAYLSQLLSTGLWGASEEAVVEQLVYRKLSEMLAQKLIGVVGDKSL